MAECGEARLRGDKGGPGGCAPRPLWHAREQRLGHGLWHFIYIFVCPRKISVPPGSLSPRADPFPRRRPFLKISKRNVYSGAGGPAFAQRWRRLAHGAKCLFWTWRAVRLVLQVRLALPRRGWEKAQKGANGSRSLQQAGFSRGAENLRG